MTWWFGKKAKKTSWKHWKIGERRWKTGFRRCNTYGLSETTKKERREKAKEFKYLSSFVTEIRELKLHRRNMLSKGNTRGWNEWKQKIRNSDSWTGKNRRRRRRTYTLFHNFLNSDGFPRFFVAVNLSWESGSIHISVLCSVCLADCIFTIRILRLRSLPGLSWNTFHKIKRTWFATVKQFRNRFCTF